MYKDTAAATQAMSSPKRLRPDDVDVIPYAHVAARITAIPGFGELPGIIAGNVAKVDEDERFYSRIRRGIASKADILLHVTRAREVAEKSASVNFVGYGPMSSNTVINNIFTAHHGATAKDFGALVMALFGNANVEISETFEDPWYLFGDKLPVYKIKLYCIEFPECLLMLEITLKPWLDRAYYVNERNALVEAFQHNTTSLNLSANNLEKLNDTSYTRQTQFITEFKKRRGAIPQFDVDSGNRYSIANGKYIHFQTMPHFDTQYNASIEAALSGSANTPTQIANAKGTMDPDQFSSYCDSVHTEDMRRNILDREFCNLMGRENTLQKWHATQVGTVTGNLNNAATDHEKEWVKVIRGFLSLYSSPAAASHYSEDYYQMECTKLLMMSGMLCDKRTETHVNVRDVCG